MQNNNIFYCRASLDEELHQILNLQKENLPNSLTVKEIEKEGFVTVVHTIEILKQMNDRCPHIIAKHNDKVVGYALCMHPSFANDIKVLKPMFQKLKKIRPKNLNAMIMGQICVEKAHRRAGIFRGLYKFMKKELANDFKTIITQIDSKNVRSINAHLAVGFEILNEYDENDKHWVIVQLR